MFKAPRYVAEILKGMPCRWAICGGWAIDLFLGKLTRPHVDVDVAILRHEQSICQTFLLRRGWRLEVAHKGQTSDWPLGAILELPRHTVWCRNASENPPFIELLLNEADGDWFLFRRNIHCRQLLESAFIESNPGIPILAPEIVLLYKAKAQSVKDTADFKEVFPKLTPTRRDWLYRSLKATHRGHSWLAALDATR